MHETRLHPRGPGAWWWQSPPPSAQQRRPLRLLSELNEQGWGRAAEGRWVSVQMDQPHTVKIASVDSERELGKLPEGCDTHHIRC